MVKIYVKATKLDSNKISSKWSQKLFLWMKLCPDNVSRKFIFEKSPSPVCSTTNTYSYTYDESIQPYFILKIKAKSFKGQPTLGTTSIPLQTFQINQIVCDWFELEPTRPSYKPVKVFLEVHISSNEDPPFFINNGMIQSPNSAIPPVHFPEEGEELK